MKIRIMFKTPDAVDDALDRAFPADFDPNDETPEEIAEEIAEENRVLKVEEARRKIEQFVRHGECVTIEFDLETGTAKVV